jgi:hypothetical protein
MTEIVEFEPKQPSTSVEFVKVQMVLNIPIVVEKASIEEHVKGQRGEYDRVTLTTDRGVIRTGAKVLVQQAKDFIPLLSEGKKIRLKIVAKTSPAGTYYKFDKP